MRELPACPLVLAARNNCMSFSEEQASRHRAQSATGQFVDTRREQGPTDRQRDQRISMPALRVRPKVWQRGAVCVQEVSPIPIIIRSDRQGARGMASAGAILNALNILKLLNNPLKMIDAEPLTR